MAHGFPLHFTHIVLLDQDTTSPKTENKCYYILIHRVGGQAEDTDKDILHVEDKWAYKWFHET